MVQKTNRKLTDMNTSANEINTRERNLLIISKIQNNTYMYHTFIHSRATY